MDTRDTIQQETAALVYNLLHSGDSVIYCGAGISLNSGLPLANDLVREIVKGLGVDGAECEKIVQHGFPFEGFIEVLANNAEVNELFSVFGLGRPNANHRLVAWLVKNRLIKSVYTTNFDTLLESALTDDENPSHTVNGLDVIYDDSQFTLFDKPLPGTDNPLLVKIHGCVREKQKMKITLRSVSSTQLRKKRESCITHIFSSGQHRNVLILGYSFSDEFDINPILRALGSSEKNIILLEHCSGKPSKKPVSEYRDRSLFNGFSGSWIQCNIDCLVNDICRRFDVPYRHEGNGRVEEIRHEWKRYVARWAESLDIQKTYYKKFILGVLMIRLSLFDRARNYFDDIIYNREQISDADDLKKIYINLSHAYSHLGEYDLAISHASKAFDMGAQIEDTCEGALCMTNLGHAYSHKGEYETAVKFYTKALSINQHLDDIHEGAYNYGNLGSMFYRLQRYHDSYRMTEEALRLHTALGNKEGEAQAYLGLGVVCFDLEKYKEAVEYYRKSLVIDELLGNEEGKVKNRLNLGNAYSQLGEYDTAKEYYISALDTNRNNKELALMIHNGMGGALLLSGSIHDARQHFMYARQLAVETGQLHFLDGIENNIACCS
jgi:tetratricopeptide (TPR) repeat protein